MKRLFLAVTFAAASLTAHAESFFQVEAGLGVAHAQTLSDGVWYQQGLPGNDLRVNSPAYLLGVTGEAYRHADYDVRWHLDYVYIGQQSASCNCVDDASYDAKHHQVLNYDGARPYDGNGHVQGVAFTLDAGYTWKGYRFGVEAGPWVFWNTWHENTQFPTYWYNASHETVAQVSWVAGASISRGNMALSYRYYQMPQSWNPFPGLIRGAHVLMFTYRY